MDSSFSNCNPRVVLVIPCFRESGRIRDFLFSLCEEIKTQNLPVAVRLVDDGSGEKEAAFLDSVANSARASFPFVEEPLLLEKNLGKGGAIYAGWAQCGDARWLAFADADGAVCAQEICRVLGIVLREEEQADAWIASRVKMLGKVVDRSLKRHIFGRVYATMAAGLTGLDVYDSQCGFKVVKKEAFAKIRHKMEDYRFGFDMELLAFLSEADAKILEVPVNWRDIPGSKVHLLRDGFRMFRSLLSLRKRLMPRS